MTYEVYKERIRMELKERLGDDIAILDMVCDKNNGIRRDGITIQRNCAASPVIYLDEFYEEYCSGGDMNEQIDEIIKLSYEENSEVEKMGNIITKGNWDEIKGKVGVELINKAWNAKKLEEAVFVKFINLALVFRVMFDDNTSCVITKRMINKWGVTTEDVMYAAFSNLYETKFTIKSVAELLSNIDITGSGLIEEDLKDCPLYVMSNEHQMFGASGLARTDLLKDFVNRIEEDIFVIPSSIHEVLLVPATEDIDVMHLKDMVKCVNSTEVSKEQWLSENIYFFGRETNELEIAA